MITYERPSPRMNDIDDELLSVAILYEAARAQAAIDDGDDMLEGIVDPKAVHKAKRLLARERVLNPTPPGERRPAGTGRKQSRGLEYHPPRGGPIDYFLLTGLHQDQFEWLYRLMEQRLLDPREGANGAKKRYIMRSWNPRTRLLLLLHWLKDYPSYRKLANDFGASASTVHHEIRDLLPKLCEALQGIIAWPQAPPDAVFLNASGAIDCSSHYRNRVHPFECEYYRGDVHAHFLTAQLVCSLRGQLWDLQLGQGTVSFFFFFFPLLSLFSSLIVLGHNNDRGMVTLTDLENHLQQIGVVLLADSGYTGSDNICVINEMPDVFRAQHAAYRSVVEQCFARVRLWRAADATFVQSPEMQELVLLVVYALVQLKNDASALRPGLEPLFPIDPQ